MSRFRSQPPWVETFLSELRRTGRFYMSADFADISARAVYQYADRHPEFEARVRAVLASAVRRETGARIAAV